jgi:hypothetical protein
MRRRGILNRLADPVLMLVVTVLVLGLAVVAQLVADPRERAAATGVKLVTISNWTVGAFFAVATTICWTLFATYSKLIEFSREPTPEPRVFARSTSINALILEQVTDSPGGSLTLQCHGDRGFSGLGYDESLPGTLRHFEVRICDVGVAAQADRSGIEAFAQHIQHVAANVKTDTVALVHLGRQPATRIALLRDRSGNPRWLSVSFYSNHSTGLETASSSPTIVFTRFDNEEAQRVLRFVELQLLEN